MESSSQSTATSLSGEFETCKRHQRVERLSGKFFKNTYICVNRYCGNSFELACLKCKNQLHKDHSIKFITLESFKNLIMFLSEQEKKQPNDAYEMYKKHRLIKQFRRKMQLIETDLNTAVSRLIMWSQTGETEENFNYKQLSSFSQEFDRLLRSNYLEFTERCKSVGRFVDYNTKKEIMQFSSTRLKECESERRKQLEQVRKLLQEIKEYSMKIIEVVLHQIESDEEDEIQLLKKRIQTMREENLNSNKDQLKAYKDGIAQLVADIGIKNEQLSRWITKIEQSNMGAEFDYGTSNFAKETIALTKCTRLQNQKELLTNQLNEKHSEIDDLKKKIARMADKINEKRRVSTGQEDNRNPSVKQELDTLQAKLSNKQGKEEQLAQRVSTLEAQIHQLVIQNEMLVMQNKQAQVSIAKVDGQNEKLTKQCDRIKKNLIQVQKNYAKQREENNINLKELEIAKQNLSKQTKKSACLQTQYNSFGDRLSGLINRSQDNNDKWKIVNDSKTETIYKLTQKCKDLIIQTKKRVCNNLNVFEPAR